MLANAICRRCEISVQVALAPESEIHFPFLTDAIDSIRSKNKLVYYHQKFRRVPYLTECHMGDYTCYFEAEMQWRRDL